MKKIYTLVFLMASVGWVHAQNVNVTFQVDMTGATVSPNGVHVAGNFQAAAGFPSDWDPAATTMLDGDGDMIYDVTVSIPTGMYEFKFINDNDWPGVESVPAVAQLEEGNGNDNRYVWIEADTTLHAVGFSGAAPAGMRFIKFKLDMRNNLTMGDAPSVSGSWIGWPAEGLGMYDPDGDSIYMNYSHAVPGVVEYKFREERNWDHAETIDPSCANGGGNREANIVNDSIFGNVCFGACSPCAATVMTDVTLQVDLSNSCINFDQVTVAGAFNGWPAPGDTMTDADGDGVYEITLNVQSGFYEYKFQQVKADGTVFWEGVANRQLTVGSSPMVVPAECFDGAGACSPQPAPANVTFRADLSQEAPGDTVWIMGNFTDPQWQDGATPMTLVDAANGIFEATIEICQGTFQYKFVNGSLMTVNEEFDGDTAVACGVANGVGGFNREATRTSDADTTLPTLIFGSCDVSTVGVEEIFANGGRFEVYPNPFSEFATVEFFNTENEVFQLQLTDITGKVVNTISNVAGNRIQIDRTGMEAGIYFLRVSDLNGVSRVTKLVVN